MISEHWVTHLTDITPTLNTTSAFWLLSLKRLLIAKLKRFNALQIQSDIILKFTPSSVNQLNFTTY